VKPLVSILIPAFNEQEFIADALRSAIEQTWRQTEIIVVDDGSTDDTLRSRDDLRPLEFQSSVRNTRGQRRQETRLALSVKETTFSGWTPTIC